MSNIDLIQRKMKKEVVLAVVITTAATIVVVVVALVRQYWKQTDNGGKVNELYVNEERDVKKKKRINWDERVMCEVIYRKNIKNPDCVISLEV